MNKSELEYQLAEEITNNLRLEKKFKEIGDKLDMLTVDLESHNLLRHRNRLRKQAIEEIGDIIPYLPST